MYLLAVQDWTVSDVMGFATSGGFTALAWWLLHSWIPREREKDRANFTKAIEELKEFYEKQQKEERNYRNQQLEMLVQAIDAQQTRFEAGVQGEKDSYREILSFVSERYILTIDKLEGKIDRVLENSLENQNDRA